MSFNFTLIGKEIKEGVFSYTSGVASSGSGVNELIILEEAQLNNKVNEIDSISNEKYFFIFFPICEYKNRERNIFLI
jgi:hypothetical protein